MKTHTLLSKLLNSRGHQPGEANYLTEGEMVGIAARIHQEVGELENNDKQLLEVLKELYKMTTRYNPRPSILYPELKQSVDPIDQGNMYIEDLYDRTDAAIAAAEEE